MPDFLSLENALLLQGGEPYYGHGWSSSTTPTAFGYDSSSVDGGGTSRDGSSIVGPSRIVGSAGVVTRSSSSVAGLYSYGNNQSSSSSLPTNNNNKLPTPLDPLLKYLKREYASSAGPQDVLASNMSGIEMEYLISNATAAVTALTKQISFAAGSYGSSRVPPAIISTSLSTDERQQQPLTTSSGSNGGGRDHLMNNRELPSWAQSSSSMTADNTTNQQQQQQMGMFGVDRSATPLTSGGGGSRPSQRATASTTTTSMHYSNEQHDHQYSSPLQQHYGGTDINNINNTTFSIHAQHQQKRRRQMPNFCKVSSSHTDNLLSTTPHLRHLCLASTDMSGEGMYDESKNIFTQLFKKKNKTSSSSSSSGSGTGLESIGGGGGGGGDPSTILDYRTSILRQRSNKRASYELASFMRLLSNEMPQDTFDGVESEVYSKVFSLVHSKAVRADDRLAGVAALDALLSVPSADEERRAIRIGNNLSNGLKAPYADYEFLHAIARALGRMAMGAANVDRVEFEIGRSLEWLRSDRSDRRLAAVLVLRELARCAPTAFYSKTHNVNVHHHAVTAAGSSVTGGPVVTRDGGIASSHLAGLGGTNDFLDHIFPVLRDPQPIVRVCAADALSECLVILMDRQRRSMTAPLCTLHSNMMEGLNRFSDRPPPNVDPHAFAMTAAVNAHGSLLVVSEMLKHSQNFIMPRFDEVCVAVLKFMKHRLILIRLEVIRLIPRLAARNPEVFGRRYLTESLKFLIASASITPSTKSRIDIKPTAFMSIGQLALAMSDESMGGGDITIPTVKILELDDATIPFPPPENGSVDYHLVELKDKSDFQESIEKIFSLISSNLKNQLQCRCDVLGCFANFVEALGVHADPYVMEIVEDMFESGLSEDLIKCLHSIMCSVPSKQLSIERRLFEEISTCLAGKAVDLFTIRKNTRPTLGDHSVQTSTTSSINSLSTLGNQNQQPTMERNFMSTMSLTSMNPSMRPKKPPQSEQAMEPVQEAVQRRKEAATANPALSSRRSDRVVINRSTKPEVVDKIVLSLQTLRTIGESYMQVHAAEDGNMLLPFLRNVISMYFDHPSHNVRREAAITCCLLLLPFEDANKENMKQSVLQFKFGDVSGGLFEEVLQKLLRMAVSDLSPVVRLCIVRGLDERYDLYLSLNQRSPLFLMVSFSRCCFFVHQRQDRAYIVFPITAGG